MFILFAMMDMKKMETPERDGIEWIFKDDYSLMFHSEIQSGDTPIISLYRCSLALAKVNS